MKFNCSKEAREAARGAKLLKDYEKKLRKRRAKETWHSKFAWLPVTINKDSGDCRWLEFVDRIWVNGTGTKHESKWVYAPFDSYQSFPSRFNINQDLKTALFSILCATFAAVIVLSFISNP